jgi:branched-chain amino acid transport system ATP-binding protein
MEKVESGYRGIKALDGISLEISEGGIFTILGSNGAGKTTILRTVSGLLSPSAGKIEFLEKRIGGLSPEKIVSYGISHVPEGRELFDDMTVYENLEMGAYIRRDHKEIRRDTERISRLFPILEERKFQLAGTLSGGEQQMLAIARGIMSRPKLLLLDEPSLGLAPLIVREIFRIIREIRDMGATILLVEQNAQVALANSKYGYVLEVGRIVLAGTAQNLILDEMVKRAYLGG